MSKKINFIKTCFAFLAVLFFGLSSGICSQPLKIVPAKEKVVLTGYTRSDKTMTLSSEVAGKITAVNYDVGHVIKEKPFFEIDTTFMDFKIESIRQSVKKIEAAIRKNRSRVEYLKKEFIRIDRLHKGDRATEVRRDAAKEELDQAKLERNVLASEKAILVTNLNELKERRKRYFIHAPKGWVVTHRFREKGEIINVNTPLARLGDYRTLVVPLAVTSKELEAIQRLPENFEAKLEKEKILAKIKWINPGFDERTRKLNIELFIVKYTGPKRGGLKFSLPLLIDTNGLWIPKAAVINRYENPRVTIKPTGEKVNIIVLGETDGYLIVSQNDKLETGMELEPAVKPEDKGGK